MVLFLHNLEKFHGFGAQDYHALPSRCFSREFADQIGFRTLSVSVYSLFLTLNYLIDLFLAT